MSFCVEAGKRMYESRAAAREARRRLGRRWPARPRDKYHSKLRPYRCQHCGYWHIGHSLKDRV